MNENLSNFNSAISNVRWFRQKLPSTEALAEGSDASSSMRVRNNDVDQNVRKESTNDSGGVQISNRIDPNSYKITTHIGRINYTFPPPMGAPPAKYKTAESFERKRQERKKDIEEIQINLKKLAPDTNKNTSKPSAPKVLEMKLVQKSGTDKTNSGNVRRCNTDINLNKTRTVTTKTGSTVQLDTLRDGSPTLRTKSSEVTKSLDHLPSDSAASTRRRAYDPIEARRYIKEQKKKRKKTERENQQQKMAYEKEQIKKRLEELRKSSKNIITKNIKKNRSNSCKQSITKVISSEKLNDKKLVKDKKGEEVINPRDNVGDNVEHVTEKAESTTIKSNSLDKVKEFEKISNYVETEIFMNRSPIESKSSSKTRKSKGQNFNVPIPGSPHSNNDKGDTNNDGNCTGIIENHRRVGILRKTELKDHSFSAIKEFSFEKENVALEILRPKLTASSTKSLEKQQKSERNSARGCNAEKLPDLNNIKFKGSLKQNEISKEKKITKQPEMSDWLRSNTVQIFPFNFIHAVRHKIDCIVDPISNAVPKKTETFADKCLMTSENSLEKRGKLEPIEMKGELSVPFVTPIDIKDLEQKYKETAKKSTQENFPENLNKSQTISDDKTNLNTNLSSISIVIVPSNTVSEVSSLKSESIHLVNSKIHSKVNNKVPINHDDDTTVSSSIFSSPDKRPNMHTILSEHKENEIEIKMVSPLSLGNVEKLKIVSRQSNNDDTTIATTARSESNESINVDFNKLLSDFNHGLSQVIEANEHLKSTLDRSNKVLTPLHSPKQHISGATQEEYTSDFEDTTLGKNFKTTSSLQSQKEEALSTSDQRKLARQAKRNHKFVKVSIPSLSSPKSGCKDEDVANVNLVQNVPDLNFNSITPTSVQTSELINNSTTTNSKSAKPTRLESEEEELTPDTKTLSPHEERLATIDQLKENLRRMINESKRQRSAENRGECKEMHQSGQLKQAKTELLHSQASTAGSSKTLSKGVSIEATSNHSACNNTEALSTTLTLSPKATTASRTHHSRSNVSKTTYSKSRTLESTSRIITEDLQHTHESPSTDNKTCNARRSRSDCRTSNYDRKLYIESHINDSRGDYTAKNDYSQKSTVLKEDSSVALHHYNGDQKAAVLKKRKSPPSIKTVTTTTTTTSRKSGCSKVITTFRISDLEISRLSSCDGNISESSMNYSNIGLYEQLIKNETTKSDYLTAVLKLREKAILDRTRRQIAWLEVQKARYKSKGLLLQIAAIRKKQRAIIMKMEKEREEIKGILESTQPTILSNRTSSTRHASELDLPQHRKSIKGTPKLLPLEVRSKGLYESPSLHAHRRNQQQQREREREKREQEREQEREREREQERERSRDNSFTTKPSSASILRANYELETSPSLEELLRQRENDLRRRREYVERLQEWHRKLDLEEAEVLNLERMLFNYNAGLCEQQKNTGSVTSWTGQLEAVDYCGGGSGGGRNGDSIKKSGLSQTTSHAGLAKRAHEMERRLKDIDKSLRELNSISTTNSPLPSNSNANSNGTQDGNGEDNLGIVRTTGGKLNRLWRRLTSQHVEKFEPNRRYKLCKADLERLYEEAKIAVLSDLAHAEERSLAAELLERSASNITPSAQSQASYSSIGSAGDIINAINTDIEHNDVVAPAVELFNGIKVPSLNLNFSTSQSEEQDEDHYVSVSMEAIKSCPLSKRTGDYSPSAAEKSFQNQSITSVAATGSERSELIKRNMRRFLKSTAQKQRPINHEQHRKGLERSLSDTQLSSESRGNCVNGATKCSLWAAHQNENKLKIHVRKDKDSPSEKNVSIGNDDDIIDDLTITTLSKSSMSLLKTETTASSSMKESVDIPSSPSSLISKFDENSNKTTPDVTRNEDRFTKISETSSKDEPSGTAGSLSRATVIQSVITVDSELSNLENEGTDSSTETLKEEKIVTENIENTSVSKDMENNKVIISKNFESKSNALAAKLSKISQAFASLSDQNSIVTNQSTNSKDEVVNSFQNRKCLEDHNNTSELSAYTSSFESAVTTTFTPTSHSPKKTSKTPANLDSSNAVLSLSNQSDIKNQYELHFESSGDEKLLADESMPQFDTTLDTTAGPQVTEEVSDPIVEVQNSNSIEDLCGAAIQNETNVSASSEKSPAKMQSVKSTKTSELKNSGATSSNINTIEQQKLQQQLMPDIINELEMKRCQQILIESEQFRQYEQVTAVPYMYVREIPNKPPPPYCPPAHGSPMTTIFPSEERIKDITYRRTHELYCEILKTDHVNEKGEKLPSVLDEQITNIYERIILDVCREYLEEHQEVLTQGDPANFHSQLAFFNPPNRLLCIQESIYKVVRRCLGMNKTSPKKTPIYSIYGHRAKRDHIGKIIIQEMYDEDDKWCNFHHEEDEVLKLIIEEMITSNVCKTIKEVLVEEGFKLPETDKVDGVLELQQISPGRTEMSQNDENEAASPSPSASTITEDRCKGINNNNENGNDTSFIIQERVEST